MAYQDRWARGKRLYKGYRECGARYEVIRDFCRRTFTGPFTVCDIGANLCYFGIRLTEDFPEARVVAFEYRNTAKARDHLARSGADRVTLLAHKITLRDAGNLAGSFDLVLALSVLHHTRGDFSAWLEALRHLGRHVICELAIDDSRATAHPNGYGQPPGTVLGYGQSHIKADSQRPIVLL